MNWIDYLYVTCRLLYVLECNPVCIAPLVPLCLVTRHITITITISNHSSRNYSNSIRIITGWCLIEEYTAVSVLTNKIINLIIRPRLLLIKNKLRKIIHSSVHCQSSLVLISSCMMVVIESLSKKSSSSWSAFVKKHITLLSSLETSSSISFISKNIVLIVGK